MKLQPQIDRLLARQASEWHQRLEQDDEQTRAAFVAWLKASPMHVKEYLETVYTDRVLGHLDPARDEDVDALLARATPVVALHAQHTTAPAAVTPPRRRRLKLAAAAAILCALAAPLLYQQLAGGQRFTTTIGEQRTLELPDASVVTLNADTRIAVHFDAAGRDVELLRGEALFEVTRDATRPFRVRTPTTIVQVVGTRFNVYEHPGGARVSVLEGRVKIQPRAPGAQAAEHLDAGEEVQVRPDGTLLHKRDADVARTVAWRERRLIFADTPLEDMVREFNRYNRTTRLLIEDVPPGTHHYNGIFDAADPQSLAALLAREPDLVVEYGAGEIVIRRR